VVLVVLVGAAGHRCNQLIFDSGQSPNVYFTGVCGLGRAVTGYCDFDINVLTET